MQSVVGRAEKADLIMEEPLAASRDVDSQASVEVSTEAEASMPVAVTGSRFHFYKVICNTEKKK
jgi:hypothetical protein